MAIEIRPAPITLSYNPNPATLAVATPQGEQQVPWFDESSTDSSELIIRPQGPLYDDGVVIYIKAPEGALDAVRSLDPTDPSRELTQWLAVGGAESGYVLFRPPERFNSPGSKLTITLVPNSASSTEEKKVRVKLEPIIKLPGGPVIVTTVPDGDDHVQLKNPSNPTGFELSVKWTITNS